MKPLVLLVCLFLLIISSSTAQPVLTAATTTPIPGYSCHYFSTQQFDPGSPGVNRTWDFTGLVHSTTSYTLGYAGCSSPGIHCADFPGANLVLIGPRDTAYYAGNSVSFSNRGNTGIDGTNFPYVTMYTNPQDLIRFPMSYLKSYVDTYSVYSTFPGSTPTNIYNGQITVIADGWGTLITPAGTFPNCLRLKQTEVVYDTTIQGSTTTILRYDLLTYTYYDTAHRLPLYYATSSVESTNGNVGGSFSYARYTKDFTPAGISQAGNNNIPAWRIYPNPVSAAEATVAITVTSASEVTITIRDITGRLVGTRPNEKLYPGDHRLQIYTGNLLPGMYTVNITSNGSSIGTQKLVIR